MITLCTNRADFSNDIAEVIRLFTDKCDIELCDNIPLSMQADYVCSELTNSDDEFIAKVRCKINGVESEYSYIYKSKWQTELERKRYEKRCIKIAVYRAMRKLFGFDLPWGSLTGIRPTRLLRELVERVGEESAERLMIDEFDVSMPKYRLASEINAVQSTLLDKGTQNSVDVYLGVPYCMSRCLYCSFASEVRTDKSNVSSYIDTLKRDIAAGAEILTSQCLYIRSAYIGGGTPTALTAKELDEVLSCLCTNYNLTGKEFTVEAGRPDTINEDKLRCLKAYGVNRISINPQTMNDSTLKLMGRTHTAVDTEKTFELARKIGFASINMDIICGLPSESIDDVDNTLKRIAKLEPENLTVHTLALKRSSRLVDKIGEYELTAPETVSKMTELGMQYARGANMHPYYMYRQKYMRGSLENIGYAKKGKDCIYNIDMMEDTTSIMAHGANSMTKRVFNAERRVERIPNPKDIATYISKIDEINEQKRKLFE